MSVMNVEKIKVVLPRSGPDEFWSLVHQHFAAEDPLRWKYLAMLALRENAGWPLEQIGFVFGHPKGHIVRCLAAIKQSLRDRFCLAPEWFDLDGGCAPDETSFGDVGQ
ncbi:MAG: hypothetical protein ACKVT0_21540 [Planctomycetaceae bacterium]